MMVLHELSMLAAVKGTDAFVTHLELRIIVRCADMVQQQGISTTGVPGCHLC